MANEENDRLETAEAIAEMLGVPAERVKRWTRQRRIPAVRISYKTIRYRRSEVLAAFQPLPAGAST